MKKPREIKEIKKKILPILRKQGVRKAALFGSAARGELKRGSDVDILIQPRRGKFSLLDLVEMQFKLEKKLNRKVDLLTYRCVHPLLKKHIFNNHLVIYEQRKRS